MTSNSIFSKRMKRENAIARKALVQTTHICSNIRTIGKCELFVWMRSKTFRSFGATKFHKNFDGMKIFSERFSAQKIPLKEFSCAQELNTSNLPHPKGCGFQFLT